MGMLGLCGDREHQRDLAVGLQAVEDVADHQVGGVVAEGRDVLSGCGIPLKDAGILAADESCGLVHGVGALAEDVLFGRDHVLIFQLVDEGKTFLELILCEVELALFGDDGLLVLRLQVVGHQDGAVILSHHQRIVVVAELFLEDGAGCLELLQGRRNFQPCLLKGCLVPVERAAGHGDRDTGDAALDVLHEVQVGVGPLGQVQGVGYGVQIQVGVPGAVVLADPVEVGLLHIRVVAGDVLCSLGRLPVAPGAEVDLDLDPRVLLHKGIDGVLGGLVAGIAAPPVHGQGARFIVRRAFCRGALGGSVGCGLGGCRGGGGILCRSALGAARGSASTARQHCCSHGGCQNSGQDLLLHVQSSL